jgi:teichuronic acid biosynthesis glycosyltransferase TuaH
VRQSYFFLSLPRHDADFTSTPWQLAKELATRNLVFFMDHPFTFWEAIKKVSSASIRWRWRGYFGQDCMLKEGVVVISAPFVWPVNFLPRGILYRSFKKWNEKILARRINRVANRFSVGRWIYVNSFNFYFNGVQSYLQQAVGLNIYHCIDPIIKPYSRKHGRYLEPEAAQRADLVVSTAPLLSQRFIREGINENSFLIPNAANVKLFAELGEEIHHSLRGISGKVMGYLGSIERRIDYALLLQVMAILPDWSLVMAGPVDWTYVPAGVRQHPRIHFIGPVPHMEAPSVIRKFDVALIPFLQDEVSAGIYPLKLFEYLAAGKPVVSTDFNPEVLEELKNVVQTASSAMDFANACNLQYHTNSQQQAHLRLMVAEKNTWAHRAAQWEALMNGFVKQKENVAA